MTDKKCPKCGSKNFQIVDYDVVGYIYEVEEGKVIAEGQDDGGEHVRTTCTVMSVIINGILVNSISK